MISNRISGYSIRMKQRPTKEEFDFNVRLKKVLKEKYPYLIKQNQAIFQHPCGWYIVDVYIGQLRLGFEIDGKYHWGDKQLDKDLKRDSFFDSKDICLIHIPNSRLDNKRKRRSLEAQLEKIIEKRIGELRKIRPSKYIKLKTKHEEFLCRDTSLGKDV